MTIVTEESAVSLRSPLESVGREGLIGVAPDGTVGALVDVVTLGEGVTDLGFGCTLPGYVGWRWTVSIAELPDVDPSVLEVALLPGDGSLLAPPWVPWADRLAEYRRTHPDEIPTDDALEDHDLDDDTDLDDADLDDDELDDSLDEALELDEADLDDEDDSRDDDGDSTHETPVDHDADSV